MRTIKTLLAAALIGVAGGAVSAHAADTAPAKTLSPQQQRMKDCNGEAKTKALKGDDRKAFMKTCLSGGKADAAASPAADARAAQQQKMKDCNAQAKTKGLAGAERKDFMSSCLKAG